MSVYYQVRLKKVIIETTDKEVLKFIEYSKEIHEFGFSNILPHPKELTLLDEDYSLTNTITDEYKSNTTYEKLSESSYMIDTVIGNKNNDNNLEYVIFMLLKYKTFGEIIFWDENYLTRINGNKYIKDSLTEDEANKPLFQIFYTNEDVSEYDYYDEILYAQDLLPVNDDLPIVVNNYIPDEIHLPYGTVRKKHWKETQSTLDRNTAIAKAKIKRDIKTLKKKINSNKVKDEKIIGEYTILKQVYKGM